MVHINLLPWREEERLRRQNEFVAMLVAGLIVAALIALGIHFFIEGLIQTQNDRNAFLDIEIKQLEAQIKEIDDLEKKQSNLLSRMDVIQNLQESRPGAVHLFDELVNTTPEGLYLTKVTQKGRALTIEGRAQSNARVSALMRNIDASKWIQSAALEIIENREQGKTSNLTYSKFILKAQQVGKSDDEEAVLDKKSKTKKPPKKKS